MRSSMWEPRRGGFTQPVLALAIHVGLVGLAIGVPGRSEGAPEVRSRDPLPIPIFEDRGWVDPGRATAPDGAGGEGCCPFIQAPIIGEEGIPPDLEGAFPSPLLADGLKLLGEELREGVSPGSAILHGRPDSDVTPPVLLAGPKPEYPDQLRRAGIGGRVVVRYVVDEQGSVKAESIRLLVCDHPLLGEAVRKAVLEARFQPGARGGRPVPVLVRQAVQFVTEGGVSSVR